jgi:hypothetical protein
MVACGLALLSGGDPLCAADPADPTGGDPALVARLHFIGSDALLADRTKAAKLNEIAALPETAALEADVLGKLATMPYRLFLSQGHLPPGAADQSQRIRPLLGDLLHRESYLEMRAAAPGGVPELELAVHLDEAGMDRWSTGLKEVLTRWTGCPATPIHVEDYDGWELKKHKNPNLVRLIRANNWIVFAWGQDDIPGLLPMLERIKSAGRPVPVAANYWLDGWAGCQRLLPASESSGPSGLPTIHLTLGLRNDEVHTRAVLHFAHPLDVTLSPWTAPTNLVHNPIISFTAVRGIGPWLGRLAPLAQLNISPLPDQWYEWGMAGIPFDAYFAASVTNAADFLKREGPLLVGEVNSNLPPRSGGELDWDPTNAVITWDGLPPIVSPTLSATSGTNGDFLVVKLFATRRRKVPPPFGLFERLEEGANLVYYGWEATGPALDQAWNLMQLYALVLAPRTSLNVSAAAAWVGPVSDRLGNSVTEVTMTAPDELTVERKSQLGLCSAELSWFLRWEGRDGFPLTGAFERQAPRKRPHANAGAAPADSDNPTPASSAR